MSEKESTKFQLVGYSGLTSVRHLIIPYFPKNIKRFIEPFAGLGRITELVKAEEYFLNDMSEYAFGVLKDKFSLQSTLDTSPSSYVIEQTDFRDFIKKYDTEDSFIFCDPPWRKNIYKNNEKPAFTEVNVITYYDALLNILPRCKGDWMITSDRDEHENGHRLQKSKYGNRTLEDEGKTSTYLDGHTRKLTEGTKLFGRPAAIRMCSNLF